MATRKSAKRPGKTPIKSPLTLDEKISVGLVELNDTQAIETALIRSSSNRYIAISRMYKTKTATEYKPKNGIWIPFAEGEKISKLMQHAFDEGLKLHWDEPFIEPDPLIYPKTIELHSDNSSNQQDGSIKQIISEVKEALDKLDECISKQNNQEVGNDQPAVSALKEHALSILGKRKRW